MQFQSHRKRGRKMLNLNPDRPRPAVEAPAAARVLLTGGHVGQRLREALDHGTAHLLLQKPWCRQTVCKMIELIQTGSSGVMLYGEPREGHERTSKKDDPESDFSPERRQKVLIVSDAPDGISASESILAKLKYNSHHLADAREAAARLRDDSFDAVLQVVVQLSDTGCGIGPEVIERIFDSFFTTKPRGIGTGLGLSIAKKIVERHCGRIDVSSTIGQGTTFTVSLPSAAGTPDCH